MIEVIISTVAGLGGVILSYLINKVSKETFKKNQDKLEKAIKSTDNTIIGIGTVSTNIVESRDKEKARKISEKIVIPFDESVNLSNKKSLPSYTHQEQHNVNEKNNIIENTDDRLLNLLEVHHKQALTQSKIQFFVSIITSLIGFALIIYMILSNPSSIWYEYITKTLPGVIIEAISILFLKQARETRDRATVFFEKLNYEKQINKSISIVDTIDDETIKAKTKAEIALRIIGIENDFLDKSQSIIK